MKQIKFRVYDTKNKNFIDGIPPCEYMLDNDVWDRRDCYDEDPQHYINHILNLNFNKRLVFQQYIGIQDIHGNEIFEGDIIRCGKFVPMEVYYDENFGGFYPFFLRLDSEKYILAENPEIVGNVFENKDLITK